MKKFVTFLFVVALCVMLVACGGKEAIQDDAGDTTSASDVAATTSEDPEPEAQDNIAQGGGFTVVCPDSWNIAEADRYVKLEKDGAFIDIGLSQMGMPPAAENLKQLSFKIAGYKWKGFEEEGISHIQAKIGGADYWCGLHISGIAPDDAEIATIVESIELQNQ